MTVFILFSICVLLLMANNLEDLDCKRKPETKKLPIGQRNVRKYKTTS